MNGDTSVQEVKLDGEMLLERIEQGYYKNIVAFVGAGISVASGVPDFRSESGIYARVSSGYYNIEGVVLKNPTDLFDMNEVLNTNIQPGVAHKFLYKLHTHGYLDGVVTQNFDDLEHKAGIPREKIVQLHGTLSQTRCIRKHCKSVFPIQPYIDYVQGKGERPFCGNCVEREFSEKVYLKPDVLFFGEQMPNPALKKASVLISSCDLLIVMGTSLSVSPASWLIPHSPETSVLWIINKDPLVEVECNNAIKVHDVKTCEEVFASVV